MLHLQNLPNSLKHQGFESILTRRQAYNLDKVTRLRQPEDSNLTNPGADVKEPTNNRHGDTPNWAKLEAERAAAMSKRGDLGICKACIKLLDRQPYCHYNWSYLCKSAKAGCRSCYLLEKSVRDHVRGRWSLANFDPFSVLDVSFSTDRRLVFIKLSGRTYNFELFQDPFMSNESSPDEPEWYPFARKWLDECVSTHTACSAPVLCDGRRNTKLPTRLVSIGNERIRLVDGSGLEAKAPPYAILSYCWGGKHDAVTTKSNLSKRMKEIDIFRLPKTMQDSIKVARKMGLEYLWIDALCIIQNSQDEWHRECLKMVEYYKSALLTISALESQSVSQGFLRKRPPEVAPVQLSKEDCIMIRPRAVPWWEIFQNAPANKRAWTLQERLLSRRVLHFTEQEVIWECLACSKREASAETYGAGSASIGHSTESPDFKRSVWGLGHDPLSIDNGAYSLWYRIVTHYTKRQLSQQADKLPAIAGIASFLSGLLAEKHGTPAGAYSLGIWLADPHSLLWTSCSLWQYQDQEGRLESAPSWSWASVAGAVLYRFYDEKRLLSPDDAVITATGSLQDAGGLTFPTLKPSQQGRPSPESHHQSNHQSNRLDRFLRALCRLPSESHFLNIRRSSTSSNGSGGGGGGTGDQDDVQEPLSYLDINAQHTSLALDFRFSNLLGLVDLNRDNLQFVSTVKDARTLEPCGLVALDQGPDTSPLRELCKPVDYTALEISEDRSREQYHRKRVMCTALRIGDRVYDSTVHPNSQATYFLLIVKDDSNEGCWRRIGMGLTRIWNSREWTTFPHVFDDCERANFRLV